MERRQIDVVQDLMRYPVKSMLGERLSVLLRLVCTALSAIASTTPSCSSSNIAAHTEIP